MGVSGVPTLLLLRAATFMLVVRPIVGRIYETNCVLRILLTELET